MNTTHPPLWDASVEVEEGFNELRSLLEQIRAPHLQPQERSSLKISAIDRFMTLANFRSINHFATTYHERKSTKDLTFVYRPSRGIHFVDHFLQTERAAKTSAGNP